MCVCVVCMCARVFVCVYVSVRPMLSLLYGRHGNTSFACLATFVANGSTLDSGLIGKLCIGLASQQ